MTHRVELRAPGPGGLPTSRCERHGPPADPYPERDTTLPVAEAITLESRT